MRLARRWGWEILGGPAGAGIMLKVKDTLRSTVNLAFDGRVFKTYHGPDAAARFAKEVRVLRHLEAAGCPFVPRLLEANEPERRIVTTNCGTRVERIDAARVREVFAELEQYGVRHEDADPRNITYRAADGRFCLIDFEFATLLPSAVPPAAPVKAAATGLRWSGWTDIGKVRKNNEDAFLGLRFNAQETHRLGKFGQATGPEFDCAFAVCDGMGGALAGEYASNIAAEKITLRLPRADRQAHFAETLTLLYREIHRALAYLGASYDECAGMQTTLSLGWFTPGKMHFAHAGDSRIYQLPRGASVLRQLTEDDTHVAWLYRQGQLTEHEARTHPRRNVLQKALGGDNQFVDPQTGTVACEPGDIFLFCTDGLSEGLREHSLVEILRAPGDAPGSPARQLVDEAVKNDGRDNTTALVVQVV